MFYTAISGSNPAAHAHIACFLLFMLAPKLNRPDAICGAAHGRVQLISRLIRTSNIAQTLVPL